MRAMKITPMQVRLAAAYPTGRAGAPSAELQESPSGSAGIVDRVELSATAKAQQRIRDSLVGAKVEHAAMPDVKPLTPVAAEPTDAIAMHRTAAAKNPAATGVAAGNLIDTVA